MVLENMRLDVVVERTRLCEVVKRGCWFAAEVEVEVEHRLHSEDGRGRESRLRQHTNGGR